MKKYNVAKIMRRAWEIKKEADRRMRNSLYNRMIMREMEESEKAIFGECLKLAWEEEKKSVELAEKYKVKKEEAEEMAKEETELAMDAKGEVEVRWNIWTGYGYRRAYFRVAGWSKYRNNKKTNFVEL